MRIYFAGSIRGGRSDAALYLQIINYLKQFGEVLTEHVGSAKLSLAGENLSSDEIYRRDIAWLAKADIIVAEVTTPSLGVGFEICWSILHQKKVLCLYRPSDGRSLSAMIAGCPKVKVINYTNLEDLAKPLAQAINKG